MKSEPPFDLTVLHEVAIFLSAAWVLAVVVIALKRYLTQAAKNLIHSRRVNDFRFDGRQSECNWPEDGR